MNTNAYSTAIKLLCVAALTGATLQVSAQEENSKEKNLNREMTLERAYDPSVQDASKVNSLPMVKEPVIRKMPIAYSTYTVPVEPQKELGILASGKVMTDMEFNKRRGYVNFGAGNYMNLNGDLGYHILSTEKDQLGIQFTHRSTNGKIKYLQTDFKQKAKLNDNLGTINYAHQFSKLAFTLGANYGYSAFNYYGYPLSPISSATMNEMELLNKNQANQQLSFHAGVASKEDMGFNYIVNLSYRNFSQKYGILPTIDGASENAIKLNVDLNAAFGGNKKIGIAGILDYLSHGMPAANEHDFYNLGNRAIGTLSPYFSIDGDNWKLKLGVNALFITGNDSKFFVSPNITADIQVADATSIYLNLLGEANANSMYEIAGENRYMNPGIGVSPSRTWLDGTIGIKSGALSGFWFDLFAGYKITDNEHFFIPTFSAGPYATNNEPINHWGNLSTVLYGNTKLFHAGALLKYSYQQLFDISLKGVYNAWDITSAIENAPYDNKLIATNKPKMELNATIDLKPVDKFTLSLNYYLGTGRKTYNATTEIKMNNINELNLTGSYAFNKTLGVYVKVNNLLCQKYDLFYGYAAQGFNAMGGVNINF